MEEPMLSEYHEFCRRRDQELESLLHQAGQAAQRTLEESQEAAEDLARIRQELLNIAQCLPPLERLASQPQDGTPTLEQPEQLTLTDRSNILEIRDYFQRVVQQCQARREAAGEALNEQKKIKSALDLQLVEVRKGIVEVQARNHQMEAQLAEESDKSKLPLVLQLMSSTTTTTTTSTSATASATAKTTAATTC